MSPDLGPGAVGLGQSLEPVVRDSGEPVLSEIAGDVWIPPWFEWEQVKGHVSGMARSLSGGDPKDSIVSPGLQGDRVLGSACTKE